MDSRPVRFSTSSPSAALIILVGLVLVGAAGCFPLRPARTPMPTVALSSPHVTGTRLYVLLPGMLDKPETFRKKGIADLIRAADPQAGILAADAHFHYYRKRILLERLLEDVITPAQEAGYEEIWLVGVSLGGFGSILTAGEYPEVISGVILLAPFLGDEDDMDQVDAERPQFDPEKPGHVKPKIEALITAWDWLDEVVKDPDGQPRVILAYGQDDGLVVGIQRLADRLPPADVFTIPGGHDWKTWRKLTELSLPRIQKQPVRPTP